MHGFPALPSTPNKSDLARRRLLDAAVEVFGRKSPEGATIREIAKAAGQNVAAIAYYFGNKDQLYRAVMEGLAHHIRSHLGDVMAEIRQAQDQGGLSPERALELLQKFLQAVYLRFLSRNEVLALARLIVREQMQPTPAFEILYQGAFRELHETLCLLVGTILSVPPKSSTTIIRTHTLMGQVYFFAMSRETILRRLGWKSLGGRNAEAVAAIIAENIDVLTAGLRGQQPKARELMP